MKTVLITGGAGFLGVYLSRFLLKKGFKVISLDHSEYTADDIRSKVTIIKGDITRKNEIMQAFKNVDYVVHAAAALPIAHDRRPIFETNVDGTKNVLDA